MFKIRKYNGLLRQSYLYMKSKMASAKASPHFSRRRRRLPPPKSLRCHSAPSAYTSVVTLSRYQRYTLVAKPGHSHSKSQYHHECFFSPCSSIGNWGRLMSLCRLNVTSATASRHFFQCCQRNPPLMSFGCNSVPSVSTFLVTRGRHGW